MKVFQFEIAHKDGGKNAGMLLYMDDKQSPLYQIIANPEQFNPEKILETVKKIEDCLGGEKPLSNCLYASSAVMANRNKDILIFGIITANPPEGQIDSLKEIMMRAEDFLDRMVDVEESDLDIVDEKTETDTGKHHEAFKEDRFYRISISDSLPYLMNQTGILWKDKEGYLLQTKLWLDDFFPSCSRPENIERISRRSET